VKRICFAKTDFPKKRKSVNLGKDFADFFPKITKNPNLGKSRHFQKRFARFLF